MADYIQIKNGSTDAYPVVDKPFVVPVGTFSSTNAEQTFSIPYHYPDYVLMGLEIYGEQRYISPYIAELTLTSSGIYIKRNAAGYWPGASFGAVLMKAN